MFEFDLSCAELREHVLSERKSLPIAFETINGIESRSLMFWGEHCVQCQIPQCYSTCDLYQARVDGNCRTFEYGIFPVRRTDSAAPYMADISFRPYSVLWSPGNTKQMRATEAFDRAHLKLVRLFHLLSNSVSRCRMKRMLRLLHRGFYHARSILVKVLSRFPGLDEPTHFLLEVFNPNESDVGITLTIQGVHQKKIRFEWAEVMKPGLNRSLIRYDQIQEVINDAVGGVSLSIARNQSARLLISTNDFVKLSAPPTTDSKISKVKCLVWDLDNTLWDGILVETGIEDSLPKLRDGVLNILHELDDRGIILSIASKNNPKDIDRVLTSFEISNLFLFPQISWKPKSQGIKIIQESLNIGMDTVAFIDDSEFELTEVSENFPEVRCYHAADYKSLLDKPEFAGSTTGEAKQRRLLYKTEEARQSQRSSFEEDYESFLRDCQIVMKVRPPRAHDVERIQELIQRTNQMNFSARRYTREQIQEILHDSSLTKYVIEIEDRFGYYGIVGFSILQNDLETKEVVVQDLALSCRIQTKKIEQKFFSSMADMYAEQGFTKLVVRYNRTHRNEHLMESFRELGFAIPSFDMPYLILDGGYPRFDYIRLETLS